MYYEGAAPCSALLDLTAKGVGFQNNFYRDDGWKGKIPWLYYQRTGRDVIYNKNRVKVKMTLSTQQANGARYAYIPFKLAKYSLKGDFLGWEDLSNQILMCPTTIKGSERYRRVGLGLVKL